MSEVFTVALIGPDGAGKTTVAARLPDVLPLPMKSIYMGVNLETSGLMLPTTRLVLALRRRRGGKPDMVASAEPRGRAAIANGGGRRIKQEARAGLRLANWLAEECFRQIVAAFYMRRGNIVVFDRHFFADYYSYDVASRRGTVSLTRRLHGLFLDRLYPKPDLAICLDAPGRVLYSRKQEAPSEWLEQRRKDYLELATILPNVVVVDATRPAQDVIVDVAEAIVTFHARRHPKVTAR
jgi:thymidylate kinase